jgi:hypothetical protein
VTETDPPRLSPVAVHRSVQFGQTASETVVAATAGRTNGTGRRRCSRPPHLDDELGGETFDLLAVSVCDSLELAKYRRECGETVVDLVAGCFP